MRQEDMESLLEESAEAAEIIVSLQTEGFEEMNLKDLAEMRDEAIRAAIICAEDFADAELLAAAATLGVFYNTVAVELLENEISRRVDLLSMPGSRFCGVDGGR